MSTTETTPDPRLSAVIAVINGWAGTKTVESLAFEVLAAADEAVSYAKARGMLAHRPDLLAEFDAKMEAMKND